MEKNNTAEHCLPRYSVVKYRYFLFTTTFSHHCRRLQCSRPVDNRMGPTKMAANLIYSWQGLTTHYGICFGWLSTNHR